MLDVIVDGSGGPATLVVSAPGGEELEVSSELTLLNLPRNRLLEMPSVGPSLPPEMLDTLECIKFDLPPDVYPLNKTEIVGTTALTKAYLYFKDAWWRTKLKKTSGTTPEDGWLPVVRGQEQMHRSSWMLLCVRFLMLLITRPKPYLNPEAPMALPDDANPPAHAVHI